MGSVVLNQSVQGSTAEPQTGGMDGQFRQRLQPSRKGSHVSTAGANGLPPRHFRRSLPVACGIAPVASLAA
ncbi:hypothetical protein [Synechococcus sp. UW105]|uniref:hypothetical protein n=1 Tax=Synechococcus sp. UW105 TaxID=337067 RepID=UPI0010BDE9E5|nr:hypothetical protein [Synechococcus sp. UW105]